jgi:hypothetical protein
MLRAPFLFVLAGLALVACSSASTSGGAPDAGYCESNGYGAPAGGSCLKGTCPTKDTSVACCSSVCATCEAKGLVSYTSAGTCPAGLCPSADVTGELHCCDAEPSSLPDGTYCTPAVVDAGIPEAGPTEASTDSSMAEAAGD